MLVERLGLAPLKFIIVIQQSCAAAADYFYEIWSFGRLIQNYSLWKFLVLISEQDGGNILALISTSRVYYQH